MRHNALLSRGNMLHAFWAQAGHAPERVLMSTLDMSADWMQWQESEPVRYYGLRRSGRVRSLKSRLRDAGI